MSEIIKELKEIDTHSQQYRWRTEILKTDELVVKGINLISMQSFNKGFEYWGIIESFFKVSLMEQPELYYYLYKKGILIDIEKLLNFAFYEGMEYQKSRKEYNND